MESLSETNTLVFFVNGQKITEAQPDPEMTLLTYLRTKLHLTGSKLGCGEGGCGACTVMLSRYSPRTGSLTHYSVNACLYPLCALHGHAVTTVEGIGTLNNLHPVQERIARFHGSQCGFCTPGIVMSMYTLLRNNSQPTEREMEDYFDGNLCRCTGYRPILDGFRTFTKEFQCPQGDQCCQKSGKTQESVESLGPKVTSLKPYNPSQEPIFPPELKVDHASFWSYPLTYKGPNVQWLQPNTMRQLLMAKHQYPEAKIVVGNTEIGIETKFKFVKYKVLISPANIPELSAVTLDDTGVVVGGTVTLTKLNQELKKLISTLPAYKTNIFAAVVEMLKWFASHQIRNVACVSGNIMTASPISDLNPLFLACQVSVTVMSHERGVRTIRMDKDFFQGYRKTVVKADEVLLSVTIPFTQQNEFFMGYKQANRKEDDISLVNAGMMVALSENNTINKVQLAFGGMAITTVLAQRTMQGLTGLSWDEDLLPKVQDLLALDLPLTPGSPGGSVEYRRALALSFFFKFFLQIRMNISGHLDHLDISALKDMENPTRRSMQVFGGTDIREATFGSLNKPLPHASALQQSTGEAVYIDDMVPHEGELYIGLVTSTHALAHLVGVDPSLALQFPGVVDYVSATDIKGNNSLGSTMKEIFAVDEVTSQGQVIGCILADSQSHARVAAKQVKVQYEARTPVITIKEAIQANSFYDGCLKVQVGNVEEGFSMSEHIVEGEAYIGGQNHFYLETNCVRVIPGENGEMEVFSSTQHPGQTQSDIAAALGIPSNKVVVRTKRIGGGFGGKETQTSIVAVPAAIAARKLGRPVCLMLDRDEDMVITGNRHPFLGKYKIGLKSDGKIQVLELKLYSNAGNSVDLSLAVMERALLQIDSTCNFPHMKLQGLCCKTNILSNTAFRGFGAMQCNFIYESIMDDVAAELGMDNVRLKEINLPMPTDEHYYGMTTGGEALRRCWSMCKERSDYTLRKQKVNQYNSENTWKKKGIALMSLKYGVSFIQGYINQSGALVHIYLDGSVLVTHGGVEIGQGLHTKMLQVASEVLELPISEIHISETSTNTVPNGPPTAASVSTDLNGFAVKRACEELVKRLAPFKKQRPDASWKDWVNDAYKDCISLSATGFYFTPGLNYNFDKQEGKLFNYFTYGAACTEVQIDCLTGEHKILRTDIVMDIGKSINPAIDIGQIEGAFTQGFGLMLLEDVKVTPDGTHLTRGPGNYKIPAFSNVPAEMNVYLVPDSPNPQNLFSSRGFNEPPICLSISVFMAVKEAIRAARQDNSASLRFQLNSPALPGRIRMACLDNISKQFPEADPETYRPWVVDL